MVSTLHVKPISVNACWRGRRFKTPDYEGFEAEMLYSLPYLVIPPGKLKLALTVGLSSKNADIDNPVKPILDCLQKKYGFNDRQIYQLEVAKVDVPRGAEYIEFEISAIPKLSPPA